ncbi:gliding motility-associated C-terminal domain-containing protein [Chitinophagaceae bacterium LB-8]|uniref:Gliding motility-associated C-terminal domain-containing protein n=1 Tax=Paraflavisolibacter caeni TaxID=2982496 RepID=A0A9X2XUP7_9BACT|nr:gliding motility-associated C-terminal domain-containing protein [Paraflavisolibacter caeni]MCU7549225.1 gliding motility-associated C-terminal domain-containing protein [Paraflavisolibacter caeni]
MSRICKCSSLEPYGVEFSPNSALLYVTDAQALNYSRYINNLLQYNVSLATADQIIQSKQIISSINYLDHFSNGALQLAPDGKIYMAKRTQNQLAAINYPNRIGAACGFVYDAVALGYGQCRFGLPPITPDISLNVNSFDFTGTCTGQQLQFEYKASTQINSVKWDFGDPLSGGNNTSTQFRTSHLFTKQGVYDVRLILFHACGSDTITKQIQAGTISVQLGKDTTLCGTDGYLLTPQTSGDNTYLWQNSSTGTTFLAKKSGLYWVEVKNKDNGCVKRDSIRLVMNAYPKFELGSDLHLCEGQTKTLTVNVPAATYLWNTGTTAQSQTISSGGDYWLGVTVNGCTQRDSIKAVYAPYPQISLGKDTILCDEKTLLLDGGNTGANYQWQDGSSGQTFLVKAKGAYNVTITKDGCSSSDTILVSYDHKPTFTLGSDLMLCSGQTALLRAIIQDSIGMQYRWQDGSEGKEFKAAGPGIYNLEVSNYCGSQKDSVIISKGVCQLYIPNAFTPNGDGHNDVFRAGFGEDITSYNIQVYNRWGTKVFESNEIRRGWDGTISGKLQPAGVYIWVIRYRSSGSLTEQVLKGNTVLIR